jgi:hypothetical protein
MRHGVRGLGTTKRDKEFIMRKFGSTLAVWALGASLASAGGIGFYGSYWDSEDPGAGTGGGVKISVPVAESLALELRGSYIQDFDKMDDIGQKDFAIIPIEADLVIQVPLGDALTLYAGGGAGYYVTPEYESKVAVEGSLEPDIDFKDTVGYFGVGGLEIKLSDAVSLFAEAKYTWLELDEAEVDGVTVKDLNGKMDGLGANAGIMFNL